MCDANGSHTPTTGAPVRADLDGLDFKEDWEYASVVRTLMYLAANTQSHAAYTVHQAARFTHRPMHSHSLAIKHILHYLKYTKDRGIILCTNGDFKLLCYVDSYFGGLFGSENPEDPVSIKSSRSPYKAWVYVHSMGLKTGIFYMQE